MLQKRLLTKAQELRLKKKIPKRCFGSCREGYLGHYELVSHGAEEDEVLERKIESTKRILKDYLEGKSRFRAGTILNIVLENLPSFEKMEIDWNNDGLLEALTELNQIIIKRGELLDNASVLEALFRSVELHDPASTHEILDILWRDISKKRWDLGDFIYYNLYEDGVRISPGVECYIYPLNVMTSSIAHGNFYVLEVLMNNGYEIPFNIRDKQNKRNILDATLILMEEIKEVVKKYGLLDIRDMYLADPVPFKEWLEDWGFIE